MLLLVVAIELQVLRKILECLSGRGVSGGGLAGTHALLDQVDAGLGEAWRRLLPGGSFRPGPPGS